MRVVRRLRDVCGSAQKKPSRTLRFKVRLFQTSSTIVEEWYRGCSIVSLSCNMDHHCPSGGPSNRTERNNSSKIHAQKNKSTSKQTKQLTENRTTLKDMCSPRNEKSAARASRHAFCRSAPRAATWHGQRGWIEMLPSSQSLQQGPWRCRWISHSCSSVGPQSCVPTWTALWWSVGLCWRLIQLLEPLSFQSVSPTGQVPAHVPVVRLCTTPAPR